MIVSARRIVLPFALAAAMATSPVVAAAEPAKPPDDWRFQALLYIYLPTVDGTTTVATGGGGGGGTGVGVDAGSILDSLQLAFMGAFEAGRGRWGMVADVVYADFGK